MVVLTWACLAILVVSCSRAGLADLAGNITELLSTSALQDAESAAYWAYHLGRTGFFLGAVSTVG